MQVFATDGLHILDAVDGSVQHQVSQAELCGSTGRGCSWGYPMTDGESFVVVPNLGNSECWAR